MIDQNCDAAAGRSAAPEAGSPLTSAQIGRAAGGGGTQKRSAGALEVLAPRTLKLTRGGRSKLSLTLTTKQSGGMTLSPSSTAASRRRRTSASPPADQSGCAAVRAGAGTHGRASFSALRIARVAGERLSV